MAWPWVSGGSEVAGLTVGLAVGLAVGSAGLKVGLTVGLAVGLAVGSEVAGLADISIHNESGDKAGSGQRPPESPIPSQTNAYSRARAGRVRGLPGKA